MVAMLASLPQMDSARSIPRNPDVLTRHPSAEDLDAAQQLICSAQAGREHPVDHPWSDTPDRVKVEPTRWPETPTNDGMMERTSPKSLSQKDASFLGHSCRYFFHSLLNTKVMVANVRCPVTVEQKVLHYGVDPRLDP